MGRKSRVNGTICYTIRGKITQFLTTPTCEMFLESSFKGNNLHPQVTGVVHTFPSMNFFYFSN